MVADGELSAELHERLITLLRRVAEAAERFGRRVSLYPHIWFYIERIEQAVAAVHEVGSVCLGVTFTGFHWYAVDGKSLRARLRDAAPFLRGANLCGSRRLPEGTRRLPATIESLDEGELDNAAALAVLRYVGFDGPIGIQGYSNGGDSLSEVEAIARGDLIDARAREALDLVRPTRRVIVDGVIDTRLLVCATAIAVSLLPANAAQHQDQSSTATRANFGPTAQSTPRSSAQTPNGSPLMATRSSDAERGGIQFTPSRNGGPDLDFRRNLLNAPSVTASSRFDAFAATERASTPNQRQFDVQFWESIATALSERFDAPKPARRPALRSFSTASSRRRRRDATIGLPNDVDLRKLALTFLQINRREWPELVDVGLLPEPSELVLDSMVDAFKARFLSGVVISPSPSNLSPGVGLAAAYLRFSDDNSNPRSLDDQLTNILVRARRDQRPEQDHRAGDAASVRHRRVPLRDPPQRGGRVGDAGDAHAARLAARAVQLTLGRGDAAIADRARRAGVSAGARRRAGGVGCAAVPARRRRGVTMRAR
jgi:hypothetical protein